MSQRYRYGQKYVPGRWWVIAIVTVLLGSVPIMPLGWAADERSYQAMQEWLKAGQEAEPTFQAGQRLTAANQEALKPFIPLAAWEYYFFPDMEMEISATGTYPPPDDWGKNVVPGYELKDDGALVGFRGGGFPFSEITPTDPQAGVKVLWNMLWRPGGYTYLMPMVSWSRGEGGTLDRQMEFTSTSAEFAQGSFCLIPGYEEVKTKSITEFRSPRDMTGTKNINITYVDPYKEDAGWMYSPAQRKPRRLLSSERTSESSTSPDYIREDGYGFDGRVHKHNWNYLGTRTVLVTMNLADNPEAGGPHKWVPHKVRWELRDTHVIEQIPKDPDHPYSHKLVFIDTETFWTVSMVAYDHQEQLFRMGQDFLKYTEGYAEEEPMQPPYMKVNYADNLGRNLFMHLGQAAINPQKPHATYTHCYPVYREFSAGRAKQFFSLRNMVSGRR